VTILNKEGKVRTIIKLIATGLASPLIIFLLACLHAGWLLLLLSLPGVWLGRPISDWYNREFPPEGWFGGLAPDVFIGFVSAWILIWIFLMDIVNSVEKHIKGKRENR
jgi:hypothetical protein